ncbi:MAG: helix-turn-helix domain-containing protein [Spirirestis rafaelensis WJT71-NPBG6]|jgi:AraC-like DNA-binding protein|nr:helix-turn-helix domain-containing protein [Spirirestis rafaelensis WJT71-NPBG6]
MIAQNEEGLQRWQNTNIDVLKHQKAICFLVAGLSIDDTAKELGVSTRTLERWFKHPEFNQNLGLAIKHVYVSSFAKAVGYVDESMNVLMGIIRDESTLTRHRIDAIKLLLDFTAKGYQETFKNQTNTEENTVS